MKYEEDNEDDCHVVVRKSMYNVHVGIHRLTKNLGGLNFKLT